jgi:hypothetical protein
MPITKNSPALVDESAGLEIKSLRGASNASNPIQKIAVSQEENCPARVIEAKRELLRDFAHEAAMQSAEHASMLAQYIAMDDLAGVKYSAAKFVAFAREAAKASRELIDGRAPR